MREFLLFPIAITVFFLPVQFLEEFNLSLEILDDAFLLFDLILEAVDFVSVQVLKLILKLLDLFAEDTVLFYLVLELLLGQLVAGVGGLWLLLLWFGLHLLHQGV